YFTNPLSPTQRNQLLEIVPNDHVYEFKASDILASYKQWEEKGIIDNKWIIENFRQCKRQIIICPTCLAQWTQPCHLEKEGKEEKKVSVESQSVAKEKSNNDKDEKHQ